VPPHTPSSPVTVDEDPGGEVQPTALSSCADAWTLLSTTAVLALCILILAPMLTFRMGVDQGVFAYMGAGILDGRWPYLRSWESDFPGLMFLQALQISVLGKSGAMFRLFDVLFQAGNAYLILRIATRVGGRVAGYIAAVVFCLIYQGYGPWNTGQREGFGLLFVLAGFWLAMTSDRRSAFLTSAAVGLGLGVAMTIKPTLLALAIFYAPLARRPDRRTLALLAVAAAGLAAPFAIIIAWYWKIGGLQQIYEACIGYQAIYTARLRGDAPLFVFWIQKLLRLGRNAAVLPLLYIPFLWDRSLRRERLMLWLAYAGSVYAVFVQGTFAGYHYLPGLAIGSILVGSMFSTIVTKVLAGTLPSTPRQRTAALWALAHLLIVGATISYMKRETVEKLVAGHFLEPPAAHEFSSRTVFDFTETYDVAAYLRARTRPNDPIQVWGYESLLYYLAERYASGRFQMTHPLVMRPPGGSLSPMQQQWRAEFIEQIKTRPPLYVAVVRNDNWWWAPGERTSEELLDDFPEWKRVIALEYQLDTTIGRFLVYKRTGVSDRSPIASLIETMP